MSTSVVDRGVNYLKIGVNRFLTVSSSTTWEKFNGAKNIGQQHQILAQKVKHMNQRINIVTKKKKRISKQGL